MAEFAPMSLAAGTRLGYEIVSAIGIGGTGEVSRATWGARWRSGCCLAPANIKVRTAGVVKTWFEELKRLAPAK